MTHHVVYALFLALLSEVALLATISGCVIAFIWEDKGVLLRALGVAGLLAVLGLMLCASAHAQTLSTPLPVGTEPPTLACSSTVNTGVYVRNFNTGHTFVCADVSAGGTGYYQWNYVATSASSSSTSPAGNLVNDSVFSDPSDNWDGGTLVRAAGYDGGNALSVTGTGNHSSTLTQDTAAGSYVAAGKTYAYSAYIDTSQVTSGAGTLTVSDCATPAASYIAGTSFASGQAVTRISATWTPGAAAAACITVLTGTAAGTVLVSCPQIELASAAGTYKPTWAIR